MSYNIGPKENFGPKENENRSRIEMNMSIKSNIVYSLNHSRSLLEGLMSAMKTREDWLYQAHPTANHPLWVVGHLGLADNMFLEQLDEAAGKKPSGWDELFWFGSEIRSDSNLYPATEEVVDYAKDRRTQLMAAIDLLTDEFLLSPTPDEGMFGDAPNMAQMLIFASFHEGVHAGQFTIAHRGLGHRPLFQPSSEAEVS